MTAVALGRRHGINDAIFSTGGRNIAAWRIDYNTKRPHTSLNGLTPQEFELPPAQN